MQQITNRIRVSRILFNLIFMFVLSSSLGILTAQEPEFDESKIWDFKETGSDASLRGLCVVNENIVWASGSNGTVLKTDDAGENWQTVSPEGCSEHDFRDIHAFDSNNAVIINAGQPAVFYRTSDGGKSWTKVFEHDNEATFFDAVAMFKSEYMIAMSDPIDGRVLLVESSDAGRTWNELTKERRPKSLPGEAGFAASGSNMIIDPEKGTIYLALGSAEEGTEHEFSRILISADQAQTWKPIRCPINRNPSRGIFGLTCLPSDRLIAVGGDYLKPEQRNGTAAIVTLADGQTEIDSPENGLSGFRSAVAFSYTPEETPFIVAVGPNGCDFAVEDEAVNWKRFSSEGFHAIRSFGSRTFWASGANGRIAKLLIDQVE